MAGIAIGVLRPLNRRRAGSFVVGAIVGTLVYLAIAIAADLRRGEPLHVSLAISSILGVIVGGGFAVVRYDGDRSPPVPHDQARTILKLVGVGAVLAVFAYIYSVS